MVEMALQDGIKSAEIEIHIDKRLPVQGGLGAGSANAVAALIGLEVELGIHTIPPPVGSERWKRLKEAGILTYCSTKRLGIAAQVGSDVPLFLIGGAVLGLDRGQEVYPLPDFEEVWCVVALPEIGVSTPQAFRDWDTLCAEEGLTAEASTYKLEQLSRAYASAFAGGIPRGRQGAGSSGVLFEEENLAGPLESALVRTGITSWIANDFERVVFRQHPSLAEIKRILAASGTPEAALHASLSGSGSALFGLYRTQGDAEAARERLQAAGVKSLLTRTLPREKYWREMLLV
jgi:4-diphosphocytidyl-2-C-methyl-D-erythritol kinase